MGVSSAGCWLPPWPNQLGLWLVSGELWALWPSVSGELNRRRASCIHTPQALLPLRENKTLYVWLKCSVTWSWEEIGVQSPDIVLQALPPHPRCRGNRAVFVEQDTAGLPPKSWHWPISYKTLWSLARHLYQMKPFYETLTLRPQESGKHL